MGIVRLPGRDAVRRLTTARERAGRRTWPEALVAAEWPVVVPAPVVGFVTTAGPQQRATDRTRVRRRVTFPAACRRRFTSIRRTASEKVDFVAYSVGWSSRKDLNRAIKRRTGASPGEFRRKIAPERPQSTD